MNNDQQELGNLRPDFSAGLLYDSTSTNGVLWHLEGVSPAQKCSKKVPPEHHVPTFGEQKFCVQPYRLLGSTGEFADGVHDVRSYLHECDG